MTVLKLICTVLLSLFSLISSAQINDTTAEAVGSNKKYILWYSPSKATTVYGVMFNLFPVLDDSIKVYPKIYGAEINLNPIGLFSPFVTLVHCISQETHQPLAENLTGIDFKKFKRVNGLQIALQNMEPTFINGIDINAAGSFESKTNGITISLVLNKHYDVNGITIAGIANHDTKCSGIQIALINTCNDLRGFQFGIWNKNQKRSMPFINWAFSKKQQPLLR